MINLLKDDMKSENQIKDPQKIHIEDFGSLKK